MPSYLRRVVGFTTLISGIHEPVVLHIELGINWPEEL